MSRLYFIPGVPTSTEFKPRTKYEIRAVEWFPIDLLPSSKKEAIPDGLNLTYNSLYMVLPFVRSIRKWVAARRRGGSRRKSTQPSQTLPPNFQQNDRKVSVKHCFLEHRKNTVKELLLLLSADGSKLHY